MISRKRIKQQVKETVNNLLMISLYIAVVVFLSLFPAKKDEE